MRCLVFRNLLPIEPVQGMISPFLVLLLLVLLFLFFQLIILKLRTMKLKMNQLVRTQIKASLSQECSPKLAKNETKNPRAKKGNSQKLKQKKQHFCHHCGPARHNRSNCYKWLATRKSNSRITSGDQNQFPSSFAPFGDLLKTLMFLLNLNGFNSSPSPSDQGFARRKGSCKVWKEKGSK